MYAYVAALRARTIQFGLSPVLTRPLLSVKVYVDFLTKLYQQKQAKTSKLSQEARLPRF